MNVAIMQPYFFPYFGYFQLITAVDLFILHDRAKYTKKGWINRNRILQNGADATISLPLRHNSDALDICGREVAETFDPDHLLNRITGAYRKAPFFDSVCPLIARILRHDDRNLFRFLHNSIVETCEHLAIDTRIAVASSYGIDSALKAQDKVIALCKEAGAELYVNAIGGIELYSAQAFRDAGLELRFIRSGPFVYPQFGAPFLPSLSIIDAMMFNPPDALRECLASNYELIPAA